MRTELTFEECRHLVQVATPARVALREGEANGTIVDLESFPSTEPASWPEACSQLDAMHHSCKMLFFREILTEEAIQELVPEY